MSSTNLLLKIRSNHTGSLLYDRIVDVYVKKGYSFESTPNIFGVRSSGRDHSKDAFDDVIGLAYVDKNGDCKVKLWEATTDPGVTELTNPTFDLAKKNGTAILAPGQYKNSHRLGKHGKGNWRHTALQQVNKVKIFRDNNRDEILDFEVPVTGNFGINIHASSLKSISREIKNYSAGCQVFSNGSHYTSFIKLLKDNTPNADTHLFTYTLFEESDFV